LREKTGAHAVGPDRKNDCGGGLTRNLSEKGKNAAADGRKRPSDSRWSENENLSAQQKKKMLQRRKKEEREKRLSIFFPSKGSAKARKKKRLWATRRNAKTSARLPIRKRKHGVHQGRVNLNIYEG